MRNAIIATIKSFNIANAEKLTKRFPNWNITLITDKSRLTEATLASVNPEYVFFPHWSWIIPADIYTKTECVVFHMTDLPFGRGGSPMQNLIVRKIYETKIAALRAEKGMDTGPVYLKRDLDISTGSANEILSRVSDVIFNDMIPAFLNAEKHLAPRPQQGATTVFSRRTPQDSDMRSAAMQTTQDLYDFVRMLDGEGYPPAFIKAGRLKLILKNAERHGTKITGTFEAVENDCE